MLIYSLPAIATVAFCAIAFSQDDTATFDIGAVSFIALTALLWPITLPFIIKKKYQQIHGYFS